MAVTTRLICNTAKEPDDALYRAIDEQYWNKCRALLQSTDAVRLSKHKGRYGHNALHKACRRNAPIDVVEAIHFLAPKFVEKLRNVETWCRASEDVVLFLLSEAPSIARKPDMYGRLPLHYVAKGRRCTTGPGAGQQRASSVSVVRRLLTLHPDAVRPPPRGNGHEIVDPIAQFVEEWEKSLTKDRRAYERFQQTLETLLMVRAHGTIVSSRIPGQWSLSHEAARCAVVPTKLVGELWRTASAADQDRTDREGDYPLHLMCARKGDLL